jgi:hypothetical protein
MGRKPKVRGVGDAISKVTKAIGIEECQGCAKRKDILNLVTMFPFKKVTKMTDEDKEIFKAFLERENKKVITIDEAKTILDLYANSFHKRIEPCNTCGGVYQSIIKQLTKLYNYEN